MVKVSFRCFFVFFSVSKAWELLGPSGFGNSSTIKRLLCDEDYTG